MDILRGILPATSDEMLIWHGVTILVFCAIAAFRSLTVRRTLDFTDINLALWGAPTFTAGFFMFMCLFHKPLGTLIADQPLWAAVGGLAAMLAALKSLFVPIQP